MKIAINAWVLRKKELDGIGTFTKEAISRIIPAHPEIDFVVMCDRGFTEDYFDFPNATIHKIFPALRHPALYIYYMEAIVPHFLRKQNIDVMVGPDGILSLRSKCKQVACIHDLNFIHQPKDLNLRNRLYYNFFFKRFAKKASRIATVSNYSKGDIVRSYSIDCDKIDVVYCGIKKGIIPLNEEAQFQIRQQYSEGLPYFLFVGTLHPRKNIVRLLAAYDLFKVTTASHIKLLIVGDFMWSNDAIKEAYEKLEHKQDVVVTGRVSEEELQKLYGAAFCLTFVPTFEGFGIPIIEGFNAGIPVITSNITSMPEVAGSAALLVDPFNESEIAVAMQQVVERSDLRKMLIANGHTQAKKFSWDDTGARLWACIKKVKANSPISATN